MKKILISLMALMIAVSSVSAVALFAYRHPMLSTQEEILEWVATEITYEGEPEIGEEGYLGYDDWQTPEETLLYRKGDCEDFSILLMYLLDLIGVKSELGLVLTDPDDEKPDCKICGTVGDGDLGGHAMVFIDGVAYEPQSGRIAKYEYEIQYVMTYVEAMYLAYAR